MKKLILICALILSLCAVDFTEGQEADEKEKAKGKTVFMKYRKFGRDPMVSIIIEEENSVIDSTGTSVVTPIPGGDIEGDDQGIRREMAILTRKIQDHRREAQKAIRMRDFQKVLLNCSEGISAIEEMEGKTKFRTLTQQQLADYKRDFKRWEFAAHEGIIQKEALEDFKKRNITLQGIIWDEKEPVAILDGNAFTEKSPYMGVLIDKISKRSVNVLFKYKEREFYYTLEFPK